MADRIQEFLQRLTPLTRSCLLNELERLEASDGEMPGAGDILAKLRAEFRKDGSAQSRISSPARYFFAPLEPLLVDGAPEHENFGRISRGSLAPIWEWISRDLLPTMARDYVKSVEELVNANNQRQAGQVTSAFQTKVIKYLETTLNSPGAADRIRAKLATYTASRTTFSDLTKMLVVLRERVALAKFNEALPARIEKLEDASLAKITAVLDAFREKQAADVLPFALALVAKRLKTDWQLLHLATSAATSKNAADIAATPYAITVSMVLDRLEDRRATLRIALRDNRVLVAKEILSYIYSTEYALQVRIDLLDESDWGIRLQGLMNAIAVLIEAEVARFPDNVGHILGSQRMRDRRSLAGRLTYLAWRSRDAVNSGAALCRKLIGQTERTRA